MLISGKNLGGRLMNKENGTSQIKNVEIVQWTISIFFMALTKVARLRANLFPKGNKFPWPWRQPAVSYGKGETICPCFARQGKA